MSENTQKPKKEKSGKALGTILSLLLGAVIGILVLVCMEKTGQMELSFAGYLLSFVLHFFLVIVAFFLQTAIHEAGHMVFGLMTGYGFVSYRVGGLMLQKTKDGLKLKKMSLAGTGGQCLMSPPEYNNGNFPYVLYNLGGVVMNLLLAAAGFAAFLAAGNVPYLSILSLSLCVIGLYLALLNGIPLRLGGVDNDGKNIISLRQSGEARRIFHAQLALSAEQGMGKRLQEMPEEWFAMPQSGWEQNPLSATSVVIRENWLMDQHRFQEAKELVDLLLDGENAVAPLYKSLLTCDRMLLCYLEGMGAEELEKLNTKEHQLFRKSMKDFLTVMRTDYLMYLALDKDAEKAAEQYEAFKKRRDSYPYAGDYETEMELVELIRQKAEGEN